VTKTRATAQAPRPAPFAPPYPPGWFDKVIFLVDRLPGSYLVWYGAFALASFALVSLARLVSGLPPFAGDLPGRALASFMLAFPAFLMHYLNRAAAGAFSDFEPALRAPEEAGVLRYRLATTPAVPSLLFSLGGAAFGVLFVVASPEIKSYTDAVFGTLWTAILFGALAWFINSHFTYRVVFQVSQVSRIYDRHARVRLSALGPHFALSRFTRRAAIASIFVLTGYLIGFASVGSQALTPLIILPNLLLAASVFVLPLLGAHRRLEAERERSQRATAQLMESALVRLHQDVERGQYRSAPAVKDAVTALDIELSRLARIPTWPWNPGTPRGVAAAVLLPVFIWLIQFGLQRLLG